MSISCDCPPAELARATRALGDAPTEYFDEAIPDQLVQPFCRLLIAIKKNLEVQDADLLRITELKRSLLVQRDLLMQCIAPRPPHPNERINWS